MPTTLEKLVATANQWLLEKPVNDYCPNGLQVEGRSQIRKIVTGVTASQALLDAAIEAGADAILVHHGYFWKNEPAVITGIKKRRLKTLLKQDVSLIAYHLPLDLHEEFGNNVQLARHLGVQLLPNEQGSDDGLVRVGLLPQPMNARELSGLIHLRLKREPQCIDGGPEEIRRIAWCTGAAQGYIDRAIALGVDAYLSGEISESTVHAAREGGIHYFAAGHHATERYGIKALGEKLAMTLGVECEFIDIPNPV